MIAWCGLGTYEPSLVATSSTYTTRWSSKFQGSINGDTESESLGSWALHWGEGEGTDCKHICYVGLVVNDRKFSVRIIFFSHTKPANSNNPRLYTIVSAPAEQADCSHCIQYFHRVTRSDRQAKRPVALGLFG